MEDNVVDFQEALAARGHGHPYAEGSAVPALPAVPDDDLADEPYLWDGSGQPRTTYVHAQRMDRPADLAGTGLVPAPRWVRPRRELDGAALVVRAERRARQSRQARQASGWTLTRGWWALRGLGFAVRGVWRIVWQPEAAVIIRAMQEVNPERARVERRELRRERRTALVVLAGTGVVGYGAAYFWGNDLLDWLAWWSYPAAALVIVPALAWAGRPELGAAAVLAEVDRGEMPASLTLDASDRGVAATLAEAFADTKIRAQVVDVRRAAGGWGWTVTLSALDDVPEGKLEALERYLNTPVGGLVLSPVARAARARDLRVVMADLLSEPMDAPERALGSVLTAAELATRFDGGRLTLGLYARHVLVIGRTRSGKSNVLHDLVDALTADRDVVVDGLDLSGGPDLRSWKPSLREYVGGPDYVAAEKLLAEVVAIIKARTVRLGNRDWAPTAEDPGHALVIDEYGLVAANPRLRELVEFVVTYGAKAGVWLVLANQRAVKDMMGSTLIGSQVHLKVYLSMSPEDVKELPKALREQGVRPHLFQQASQTDPGDAGKAFVIGVEPMPILARFDLTSRTTAMARASERAPYRPALCEADQEVIHRTETAGVPELLVVVREAVLAVAGAAGRNPARASGEEIAAHIGRRGYNVDKTALVRELRNVTGGLISKSRDTNLASGSNPKGFYLEDLDRAVDQLRARAAGQD